METRISRQATRALYDRIARWYDLIGGHWERKLRLDAIQAFRLDPAAMVLEIGPGTGQALQILGEIVVPHGRILGVDLSVNMLAMAQERMQKHGLPAKVLLACGDAIHLPCGSSAFDAVLINFTLELFSPAEIPIVLAECERVLRAGGQLVLVAVSDLGPNNLVKRFYHWAHHRLPTIVDCRPIHAAQWVAASGLVVKNCIVKSIYGLPVEVILAQKTKII